MVSAGLIGNAKHISLTALNTEMETATAEKKDCIVIDKNGNCNVFFRYKKHMKDLH